MNKIIKICNAYKEMHRLESRVLPMLCVIAIVSGVAPFVNIWFTSKIIDSLSLGAPIKTLALYIGLAVGLNFALFLLTNVLSSRYQIYRRFMYNREQKNVAEKLYSIEYKTLENNEFKEMLHKHQEAQYRSGSTFWEFAWMTKDFISGAITLVTSIAILIPLFKIGFTKTGDSFFEKPVFLCVIIAVIAVMAVIIVIVALRMNKAWFQAEDEYASLNRLFYYFVDMINDYKTGKEIRVYKQQKIIEKTAAEKILTDGERLQREASIRSARSSSFVAVLGALVGFGIYLFIGVKGLFGLFGIGSLVLYCGSFMQIINAIMRIAGTFGKTEEFLPVADYYFEIMNTKDEMTYGEKELDLNESFEIEFKNVFFKYPGAEDYSLENVSIKINCGENLAVVGRNGSGKTTFIKLLCRLYDVTEGEILINGINIKEYTKESLMDLYSVVFQDFKMFSLPLYQNVSISEEYDRKKLFNCLDEANIKERTLKLPKEEKTYLYKDIEKNGVEISGGEAQKLALARALYKDAPIVVLDEPTASLDPIAENEIYSRFNSFTKDKTAIYISHRLSSCAFCNKIAVFDKGKLVEFDTHKELLKNENSKYYALWTAQAKYYS